MPINEYGTLDFPSNPKNNDVWVDENTDIQWRFNGTDWAIYEPYYINDLSAVDTETNPPEVGYCLEYNGTHWVPKPSVFELNDLSDVQVTGQIHNQFLIYNGTYWVNTFPAEVNWCSATATDILVENNDGRDIKTYFDLNSVYFTSDSALVDLINDKVNIVEDGLYRFKLIAGLDRDSAYNKLEIGVDIFNSGDALLRHEVSGLRWFNHTSNLREEQSNIEGFINLDVGDYLKFYYYDPIAELNTDGIFDTNIQDIYITVLRESGKV